MHRRTKLVIGIIVISILITLIPSVKASAVTTSTKPRHASITCSTTGPDATTITPGVLTQVPKPVITKAACPSAPASTTGVTPYVYVTFGTWIYIHLTPSDVAWSLWTSASRGWPYVFAMICAVVGLADPAVGAVCAIMVAEFGLFIPGLLQEAWNRNHGGIVFENFYGLNVYSYYYSGNGQ